MICIENLTKAYGTQNIITDWKFKFENRKIYGLIGRIVSVTGKIDRERVNRMIGEGYA